MRLFGIALLALVVFACEQKQVNREPQTGAPFYGSANKKPIAEPKPTPVLQQETAQPLPAIPQINSVAEQRKQAWLTEKFRCRAISTVRLRKCQFEAHEGGYRLKFQVSDAVCEDVEFDENGDPARLLDCKSAWLRIPRNNKLKRGKKQDVWSGSHSGWRWKDGSKYCCPGMWIEAPERLQEF